MAITYSELAGMPTLFVYHAEDWAAMFGIGNDCLADDIYVRALSEDTRVSAEDWQTVGPTMPVEANRNQN